MLINATRVAKKKSPVNLPTAFWGLLRPRKDVTVDFIKIPIFLVSLAWPEIALGSKKTPKSKMC